MRSESCSGWGGFYYAEKDYSGFCRNLSVNYGKGWMRILWIIKDLYELYGIYRDIMRLKDLMGGYFETFENLEALVRFRRNLLENMTLDQAIECCKVGFMVVGILMFILITIYYISKYFRIDNCKCKLLVGIFISSAGWKVLEMFMDNFLLLRALDPSIELLWELKNIQ